MILGNCNNPPPPHWVMLGKLTFQLFLYTIQSTTHMRLSTYLRSVGQLEEGRKGGELSHFGK